MYYSTYRFTLDIHKTRSQVSIPVLFQDTWVKLLINLTDGGKPYVFEDGCTARLVGKKADGTALVQVCPIIDDNTRIEYTFTEQTASALGPVECEIRLFSSSGLQLTSPSFTIVVGERVIRDEDIIESETDKSAIDRILASEEVIKAAATKAEEEADRAEEAASKATAGGATFIPDVSEDGILSWTNDKDLPNPEPVKIAGKNGKTAYDYAKDGGYKGREDEFATRLAEDIPRSLSDLENDLGFINDAALSSHNVSGAAHNDIRILLAALSDRINAALDSDDATLDQWSEIVAYIKSNKSLIDAITTSKVNVADIIDNLSTNLANKPLSAAQGVALKALVDGKISLSGLQAAISTALAEAKASGEFDGKDGVGIANIEQTNSVGNGKVDIYTITLTNGVTYTFAVTNGTNGDPGKDGVGIANIEQTGSAGANIDIYTITLTNGTSYTFAVTNGTNGDPGKDGTSPTVAVSKSGKVTTITLTDKNGTKTATVNDGADGSSVSVSNVSESTASGGSNVVTFSDGKKLTVKNGKDGDDYVLTPADKQEIKNAIISSIITQEAGQSASLVMSQKAVTDLVEDALGSGGSTQYETVDSVDKMTDTSKKYVLSTTGTIWEYGETTVVVEPPNKFVPSTATLNQRMSGSSGSVSANQTSLGSFITDFIAVSDFGSISNFNARLNWEMATADDNKILYYNSSKTRIGNTVFASQSGNHSTANGETILELKNMGGQGTQPTWADVAYIRLQLFVKPIGTSLTSADIANLTITFDHEGGTRTENAWYDTGLQPAASGGNGNYVSLLVKVNENTSYIDEVSKRVTALENESEKLTVPSFWENAVNACISKIKALQVGRNCVTFPFFSDNHQRNGYAGLFIARVMKECHIPYAFYGGDSISSGYIESEAVMIEQDKAFDTAMSYIPNGRFCRAIGNHDGYWAVDANERHEYTDAQNYELFLREESVAQNKHFGGDGTYYYVDDIASKVRWIVLDTNDGTVESEQISWLQNTALSFTESGWAVVFISHQPISNHYHANIGNAAEVRTVVKNYINGSAANKAAVVGWYSGHIHRDRIYTGAATNTENDSQGTAMGFTQVTITSDHTSIAYDDATKHTVANDDKSHAIDFVTINKSTRKVTLTRLGIGSDRSYTY